MDWNQFGHVWTLSPFAGMVLQEVLSLGARHSVTANIVTLKIKDPDSMHEQIEYISPGSRLVVCV